MGTSNKKIQAMKIKTDVNWGKGLFNMGVQFNLFPDVHLLWPLRSRAQTSRPIGMYSQSKNGSRSPEVAYTHLEKKAHNVIYEGS